MKDKIYISQIKYQNQGYGKEIRVRYVNRKLHIHLGGYEYH